MHRLRHNSIVDDNLGILCMKVIIKDVDHLVYCSEQNDQQMNMKLNE